jgi:hypothetical protein
MIGKRSLLRRVLFMLGRLCEEWEYDFYAYLFACCQRTGF